MAAPILDLDKLTDRPTVIIDGQEYWLLTLDIMPPLDAHHFSQMHERASALLAGDRQLSEPEEAELAALPNRLCRLVLEAPEDVHARLDDRKRMLIARQAITTFQTGLRMPAAEASPVPAGTPSTGASGFRG